jgi:hypothetical protein
LPHHNARATNSRVCRQYHFLRHASGDSGLARLFKALTVLRFLPEKRISLVG